MELYSGNYSTYKKLRTEHDKVIERKVTSQKKRN